MIGREIVRIIGVLEAIFLGYVAGRNSQKEEDEEGTYTMQQNRLIRMAMRGA